MKQLHDLDPAEVSLVPRGAVQKKFLIFKSRNGEQMTKQELEQFMGQLDPEALQRVEAVVKILGEARSEGQEQNAPLDQRAQAALKAIARIYAPFKDVLSSDMVQQAIDAVGKPAGDDSQGGEEQMADKDKKEEQQSSDPKDKAHQEALDVAKKAYCDHMQKAGYQKKADKADGKQPAEKSLENDKVKAEPKEEKDMADENKDSVAKSLDLSALPKEVQPAIEAIFKAQEELVKKNESLQNELNGVRREAKRKEFVAKAEEYSHLSVNKEELATSMLELSETNPKQLEFVQKTLAAANEQAKAGGIFKELGSNQEGNGKTTWEMIESKALATVQKSGEVVTKEQATDEFLKTQDGARMYNEYIKQHPSSK